MSVYDFNAPVKYTPPEPKSGNPGLIIGIVAGVLVLAAVGYFVLPKPGGGGGGLGSKREQRLVEMTSIPEPKAVIGTAKTWRTLATTKPAYGLGHLRPPAVVGHFGKGKDNDILLVGMKSATEIYRLDGSHSPVPWAKFFFIERFFPWDYNHDGVDELVPVTRGLSYIFDENYPVISYGATSPGVGWPIECADGQLEHVALDIRDEYTPVYNASGKEKSSFVGGFTFGQLLTGDLDGDGRQDLLVKLKKMVDTYSVFGGPRAERLKDITPESNTKCAFCGDLDGSGRDSLVSLEGNELALYDLKSKRKAIGGWPAGYFPTTAADINGDKVDEVIVANCALQSEDNWDQGTGRFKLPVAPVQKPALVTNEWWQKQVVPRGGIFNPKTQAWVELKFPKGPNWLFNIFQNAPDEVAVGDYDGDGQTDIAIKASVGSALFIFNAKGECTYYEEFGAPLVTMGTARGGGKDHLVVQTPEKLLVWP
jgi:hypothetical protein